MRSSRTAISRAATSATDLSTHFPEAAAELQAAFGPYLALKDMGQYQPYFMSNMFLGLRTPAITTDEFGYRSCFKWGRRVDLDGFRSHAGRTGVVSGGSVVFGNASSNDRYTLSNVLNERTDGLFWNCGVGGGNGLMEVLSFLLTGRAVDIVVAVSGANDLILHLGSPRRFPFGLPFEGEESFFNWNLGQGPRSGSDSSGADALDELGALCTSLDPLLRPDDVALLVRSGCVRERYERCLTAMRSQLGIFHRVTGGRLVFVINPHLYHCKNPTEKEDLYFRIALSRMPHLTRCMRLIVRELWGRYRSDLARICETLGVPFVDANGFDMGDGICFIDDFHPTDLGFQRLAAGLIRAIPTLSEWSPGVGAGRAP